ncbi:MAG: hypothetical protein JNM08_04345, partial [Rubrivivax sp.]|nr:hypothetical protein [Rubrivivax sp.]
MLRRLLQVAATLVLSGLALLHPAAQAQSYVASTGTGAWVSTTGHASAGVVCDDCVSGELPLGFTFSLGGVSYTTARISSNGRVQFNNTANDYSGGQYPNASTVRTLAAGYRDLHPGNGGSVTYATVGTAPNRQFVATWANVPLYGNTATRVNFQVLVNENGSFVYQYGAMGAAVYIGYQVTTTDYVVYAASSAPASGTAVRWAPSSTQLRGTVFEDLNYGGGAGRTLAAASGVARPGATVELYNASGVFVSSTTTAADGSYSFTVNTAGTSYVRVASPTVTSSRSGSTTSLRGVLTYRTTAASGSVVAVTDHVGGTNPAATDPGAAAAGATFNTGSFVYSAGLSGTAQAVTPVAVTLGTNVSGLDFGFNFGTVVNTNDSGAGSLRQVMTNANTLGGDAGLAVSGRAPGVEHVVFMIPNGTASAGLRSSLNLFSGGVATIRPASALPTVSAQLVMDARTQPGWTRNPVVELDGNSAGSGVHGLQATAAVTIGGFTINRFGGNGVQINTVSGGYTIAGNWVGLDRTGTNASRNNGEGVSVWASPNGVIGGSGASDGNVISGNGNNGVTVSGAASTSTWINGNRIGTNAA